MNKTVLSASNLYIANDLVKYFIRCWLSVGQFATTRILLSVAR
jgi:hypothetical protein